MPRIPDLSLFLQLAARNLSRQRGRSAATLAAIGFGVAGLILSGGFVADSLIQLREAVIHSQSGHAQVAREGFFSIGSRSPEKFIIADPAAMAESLAAIPGVKDVMARLSFSGLLNNGRADLPIVAEGVEPGREAALGTYLMIAEGRELRDEDRYGILVGQGAAKALQIKPGERVNLVVLTGDGAMNVLDFEVLGIFQSYSQEYDARAVRIPLAAAQELLSTRGASVLVLSLHRTSLTDAVVATAREFASTRGLEVKTWLELNDFYQSTAQLYERQLGFLRLIILVMVAVGVVNAINMTVFERAGEFGTMRALGDRARTIIGLVVTEGVLLGLIGAAAGVFIGVAVALIVSAVGIPMPPPPNSNLGYTAHILVVPSVVGGAFTVGVLAAGLGAIPPALRVARMPVVDALRQSI